MRSCACLTRSSRPRAFWTIAMSISISTSMAPPSTLSGSALRSAEASESLLSSRSRSCSSMTCSRRSRSSASLRRRRSSVEAESCLAMSPPAGGRNVAPSRTFRRSEKYASDGRDVSTMEFHGLRASRSSRHHGRRTHATHMRKEVAHRFVRPQSLGWHRHADLDAVPVGTDDLRGAGIRLDEDVHDDTCLRRPDRG